jgi:hypothetical protein
MNCSLPHHAYTILEFSQQPIQWVPLAVYLEVKLKTALYVDWLEGQVVLRAGIEDTSLVQARILTPVTDLNLPSIPQPVTALYPLVLEDYPPLG